MVRIRRLLESWMGLDPVAAGEDTRWHLRFDISWADWALALFVLFAVGFVIGIYLRESTASRRTRLLLAGLRLAVIAVALLMISGLEISIDRTGLPYLLLLVDDSESMGIRDPRPDRPRESDSAQLPRRIDRVREWLTTNEGGELRLLTQQHKLRLYAHSNAPRVLGTYIQAEDVDQLLLDLRELEPTGEQSRLGANLRAVLNDLRGIPPSSVVLITDGVTTQGESLTQAAQHAARKSIPVFTVGVGNPETLRDLELHDLLVDDTVFVEDTVRFEAKLTSNGYEGRDVVVQLKQKGFDSPLQAKTYHAGKDGVAQKVEMTHRPTAAGTIEYIVEVVPAENESRIENNRIIRAVKVIDEKIRVLYVDAYPRYEFRFLKNLLEREPTVELSVLLLDADPEYVQLDRAAIGFVPTSKQELFEFDVVILGDVSPAFFSPVQLANLRDFVRIKGGGLLFLAGSQFSPYTYRDSVLQELLPIEVGPAANRNRGANAAEKFHPRITVEGQSVPMFRFSDDETENEQIWGSFPPVYWYVRSEKLKPAAVAFAEHPSDTVDGRPVPLLASQFYGSGRTYFQGFDSTWRWRYRVGDLYHARYWVQTIRFLSRAKLLGKNRNIELLTDRRKYRRGAPVQLRVRFLDETQTPKGDDGVTVHVERQGHGERPIVLARMADRNDVFEAVYTQSEDGDYRVRLTSPLVESPPTAEFSVLPPPGEMDRFQMNEPELREVARITGGKYLPIDRADELFRELPPGRKVALHTDPPFELWNTWPVLLLFVGLLTVEWIVRKRNRML